MIEYSSISLKSHIWGIISRLAKLVSRIGAPRALFSNRKLSALIAIYGVLCVLSSQVVPLLFISEIDRFVGYYGLGDDIEQEVRITENIDLQTMMTRARASGYNVTYTHANQYNWDTRGPPDSSSIRSGFDYGTGDRFIGINYFLGNQTFDYPAPTWAQVNYPPAVTEEWIKLRLQEFFPQLTESETSEYANRLMSGYGSIGISGNPEWEIVTNYLGNFSYVGCVPIGEIYKHYSNGEIFYQVPSLTISKGITLIWSRSVIFRIIANGSGFVAVYVNSKYMLDKNWIREVFEEMFANIGLPSDGIMKYSLNENWVFVLR